ncbi:predicted phosphohydrolase [Candidatus Vecturithrix granuli]|uniref:Predicted phosphohydrolase n=1 Tax=Vecturithrix granuli TaxID=1499967 RepID=A0A081BTR5_VECG1|nr:predicted phosphohydrolase [Candidatus Vecturithrix granuli]
MKFLHLSDLHFRSHPEYNRDILTTLDMIREHYPFHYLIITGDITDDGHEIQYEQAYQALAPFVGRIFICPGNHDFGAKGNLFSRERAERFDRMLAIPLQQRGTFSGDNLPVLHLLQEEEQQILLIALDTNLETLSPFDFACGQVGATQLTALNSLLSDPEISDMIVVVFFHHHPFLHTDPLRKLLDAKELMRILYKRVHLVLFGHHHVSKMWVNTLGIPYILACDNSPGKAIAREITIVQQNIAVQEVSIENIWDTV